MANAHVPTVLIILGITGDLAQKKIIPALFNLYGAGLLPPLFQIIGYGRRPWAKSELQQFVREVLEKHGNSGHSTVDSFTALFSYQEGLFETVDGYTVLSQRLGAIDTGWGACSNKLFYLSVPPEKYETILEHLKATGLSVPCSDATGWTRVLVEKPFGRDAASAERLDARLGELFSEEQIYRIDHYLAKEALQNILTFRFANDIFEGVWSGQFIERIDIRVWEKLGVESRGAFYDAVGALRDVGQNHLLQMLALVAMDRPESFTAEAIRRTRADFLQAVATPTALEIQRKTYRAQYKGYQDIAGVAAGSNMETFFSIELLLAHPRWKHVPVTLEWGKRMAEIRKDIVVHFKHQVPCLCPPSGHRQNTITFSLEPEEKIHIDFWAKQPSHAYAVLPRALEFALRGAETRTQYVEEYEKLLLDAIQGDQTLFVSTEEVAAMWRVIDPITAAWEQGLVPLHTYTPGTNEASQLKRT